MAEGIDGVKTLAPAEERTQARVEMMADGLVALYLKRILEGTATSSEMKAAQDYIINAGVKLVVGPKTKAGELARALPKFDEEGKVIKFG